MSKVQSSNTTENKLIGIPPKDIKEGKSYKLIEKDGGLIRLGKCVKTDFRQYINSYDIQSEWEYVFEEQDETRTHPLLGGKGKNIICLDITFCRSLPLVLEEDEMQ